MTNCSPAKIPVAALQKGEAKCVSAAMLQPRQKPCCSLSWEVHNRNLGARWHSCFSAAGLVFAHEGSSLGDVVCGGHFHASPRAACLCASASCPRAPGAVLLWGGKSTGLWCSIDCFSLCVINTEPPQTDLVCSAPGLGGIHVFQICLKVNLHSSIFLTSLLYFLGTSTCCQFSRFGGTNAVLLQCLLCFEQSRVQVISPLAMLADGS